MKLLSSGKRFPPYTMAHDLEFRSICVWEQFVLMHARNTRPLSTPCVNHPMQEYSCHRLLSGAQHVTVPDERPFSVMDAFAPGSAAGISPVFTLTIE